MCGVTKYTAKSENSGKVAPRCLLALVWVTRLTLSYLRLLRPRDRCYFVSLCLPNGTIADAYQTHSPLHIGLDGKGSNYNDLILFRAEPISHSPLNCICFSYSIYPSPSPRPYAGLHFPIRQYQPLLLGERTPETL